MSEYFELSEADSGDATQVAFAVTHGRPAARRLHQPGRIEEPLELSWSWASPVPPGDLIWTVDGIRLVSAKVRQIFDAHLSQADEIQWLPGTIIDSQGRSEPHWVPHFPVIHDLLDHQRSQFGPSGLPIRYAFAASKLAKHSVTISHGTRAYVITAAVVDDLRAAALRGAYISRAPVA